MNFDITNFQSLAPHLPVEGEVCDVNHAEVSIHTKTNTEIAPLIQQVAETDGLITELQQVRNDLHSGGERVEREMVRYTKLTQMASFTAKIIFDTISQWHPAINRQKPSASEATVASAGDDMGVLDQRDTSELSEDADS